MSMAVSLEVRCPLLDHFLAEFVAKIPSDLKMRGWTTKYIFKKMAVSKGLVPREIAYQKKEGFGPPLDKWIVQEWQGLTEQLLDHSTKASKFFDKTYVRRMLADPYINVTKIFGLMVFSLWHQMYMESGQQLDRPKSIYDYI